jgi:hypothetical protein
MKVEKDLGAVGKDEMGEREDFEKVQTHHRRFIHGHLRLATDRVNIVSKVTLRPGEERRAPVRMYDQRETRVVKEKKRLTTQSTASISGVSTSASGPFYVCYTTVTCPQSLRMSSGSALAMAFDSGGLDSAQVLIHGQIGSRP